MYDLSKLISRKDLKQVAPEDRIPGRLYFVGGALDDGAPISIRIYHSDSFDSCHNGDK